MNTVTYLMHKDGHFGYEEMLKIKEMGPDRPMLSICQTSVLANGRQVNHYFNTDWYTKVPWLCGCADRKLLYCFPCLLFRGDKVWTKIGTADIKHLFEKAKMHEYSKSHIQNATDLALLGKANIVTQMDTAFQVELKEHNKKVDKNRYLLSRLIDCIKFCGMFELALRNTSTKNSENRSIFLGLVDFVAELDAMLKDYLNSSTVFKEKSKTVQNELLECMLYVCRKYIKQEISSTKHVALLSDETTDYSTKFQLVLVYRYTLDNGNIVERFWGFCNPNSDKPSDIAETILSNINEHFEHAPEKLVSQSYDAASMLTPDPKDRVHNIIKQKYTNAHSIHSYAHQLSLVIQQATSKIPQIKLFFANLAAFSAFFNKSLQCISVLNAIVHKRTPQTVPKQWDFEGRAVITVYTYRVELLECLESIVSAGNFDKRTLNDAVGLLNHLESDTFMFWLTHFFNVLPQVEVFANHIQKRNLDVNLIKQIMTDFEGEIIKIRNELEAIEAEKVKIKDENDQTVKNVTAAYKITIAKQICDIVLVQVRERFIYVNHFVASNLFNGENYEGFMKQCPKKEISAALQAYPFIDRMRLKTELSILYSRTDFQSASGILPLLNFFIQNKLHTTYAETTKLLTVLATIPMITNEPGRCFPTLENIKTFLRSAITEDQLNALTMLAIEKQLVQKEIPEFNKQVIEKFASIKNRRRDFVYK